MSNEIKYSTLIQVLDKIRADAPETFRTYHPDPENFEKVNQARAKAFIHLYLKVRFGLSSFTERQNFVSDKGQDGGVDAYYFDEEKKKLYLIQSKFRTNPDGFKSKSISAEELIKIETTRILKGESVDSNGKEFNGKIHELQSKWKEIRDHANWEYSIVLLGNLTRFNDEQIRRLIDNVDYEIFDFNRTYDDLIFPLGTGTFFDPKEIQIKLELNEDGSSVLKRKVNTKYGTYDIRVLFVPASEIARVLSRYKNSILQFNPRNYLSLSKNKVNKGIRDSILNSGTNEFAVYNNGITLVSNSFNISETTGEINVGQIIMQNPQIINGGQTAYTLSKIWESSQEKNNEIFDKKEVMLKVIIINDYVNLNQEFLEDLSNATNKQSRVEEADRRSNEGIQIEVQRKIFEEFGHYYERKKGEFYYGLDGKYIPKHLIIDRYDFLRAYLAFNGQPRWARQRGSETLFRKDNFDSTIDNSDDFILMFFSYKLLKRLYAEESDGWGFGIRYGKMAIIAAISRSIDHKIIHTGNIDDMINTSLGNIRPNWMVFENWVKAQKKNIESYGGEEFDFDNYYKGKTVNQNIVDYFD